MNERIQELGDEVRARRVGVEAVNDALYEPPQPPQPHPVEIALYVNGRLVNTKTDSETVMRIMAILTGLGQ